MDFVMQPGSYIVESHTCRQTYIMVVRALVLLMAVVYQSAPPFHAQMVPIFPWVPWLQDYNLGAPLAKTVIKEHILTGKDCMSKVGTKHAAMASEPVQYLTNFGELDTLPDQDTALAEKYLICVWAGVRSNTTFDDLRLENYYSARAGVDALPPTSSVIRCHIQRSTFLVHRACHLFETAKEPMAR